MITFETKTVLARFGQWQFRQLSQASFTVASGHQAFLIVEPWNFHLNCSFKKSLCLCMYVMCGNVILGQFEVSRTCFLSWAAECWALPFFVCPHCWYLLGLFRSDRLLLLPHTFLTTLVSLFIMPRSLFPLCLSSFSQYPSPVFCFTFSQFWKAVLLIWKGEWFLMSSLSFFLSYAQWVKYLSGTGHCDDIRWCQ